MDWTQTLTIIISIIGGLGTFMFWMFNKLDNDIKIVSNELSGWTKHLTAMQAEQSKRTDALHEHIAELIRTRKM